MRKSRWIYFIQLGKELPEYFFYLSSILNSQGIKVLPVSPEQFFLLYRQQYNVRVIVSTPSMATLRRFEDDIKPAFKQLISNKMLTVYHLSSFYSMTRDFKSNISRNHYVHVKLPVVTESVAYWIGNHFSKNSGSSKSWPGGRRATLPAMGA
jgi:hypothetical protein